MFVKPVSESLGFTRGGFTLYFTIAALAMMVMAPVMGKLLERYDIRVVMTISTTIMPRVSRSFRSAVRLRNLCFGRVSRVGSAGSHIIPVSMMITNCSSIDGDWQWGCLCRHIVGGMIFNPLANWIILHHGWQAAYLTFGLIIGVLSIPTAIFMKSLCRIPCGLPQG